MKKYLCSLLSLLLIAGVVASPVKANESEPDNEKPAVCGVRKDVTLVETEINEYGEQVDKFSDNSQTIYHADGRITVLIPTGAREGANAVLGTTRIGWIAIGRILLEIVGGILTTCKVLEYINGENPCDVAVANLKNPPVYNGSVEVDVKGIYHEGYIPGCEPSHSWGCNQGYWEYEFEQV